MLINNYQLALATFLLLFFAVYSILLAVGIVVSQYVQCARYDFLYLIGAGCGAVLSLICAITLIPAYGAFGAAWGVTLSHFVTIFIYGIITCRSLWVSKRNT